MQNWTPEKGDYVKQNAMEDSKRRKRKETINKALIYGIITVAVATLIMFLMSGI